MPLIMPPICSDSTMSTSNNRPPHSPHSPQSPQSLHAASDHVLTSPIQQMRAKLKKKAASREEIEAEKRKQQQNLTRQRQNVAKLDLERRQATLIQAVVRRFLTRLRVAKQFPKMQFKYRKQNKERLRLKKQQQQDTALRQSSHHNNQSDATSLSSSAHNAGSSHVPNTPNASSKPEVVSIYKSKPYGMDDDSEHIIKSPFLMMRRKLKKNNMPLLPSDNAVNDADDDDARRESDAYAAQKRRQKTAYESRLQAARMDLERRKATVIQSLVRSFLVRKSCGFRFNNTASSSAATEATREPEDRPGEYSYTAQLKDEPDHVKSPTFRTKSKPYRTSAAKHAPSSYSQSPYSYTTTPTRGPSRKLNVQHFNASAASSTASTPSYITQSAPTRFKKSVASKFGPLLNSSKQNDGNGDDEERSKSPYLAMKRRLRSSKQLPMIPSTDNDSNNDDNGKDMRQTPSHLLSPSEGYQRRKTMQKTAYQQRLDAARHDLERREITKLQSIARMFLVRNKKHHLPQRKDDHKRGTHGTYNKNRVLDYNSTHTTSSYASSAQYATPIVTPQQVDDRRVSPKITPSGRFPNAIGALPFATSPTAESNGGEHNTKPKYRFRSNANTTGGSSASSSAQNSPVSSSSAQNRHNLRPTMNHSLSPISKTPGGYVPPEQRRTTYDSRLEAARRDNERREATKIQSIVRMFLSRKRHNPKSFLRSAKLKKTRSSSSIPTNTLRKGNLSNNRDFDGNGKHDESENVEDDDGEMTLADIATVMRDSKKQSSQHFGHSSASSFFDSNRDVDFGDDADGDDKVSRFGTVSSAKKIASRNADQTKPKTSKPVRSSIVQSRMKNIHKTAWQTKQQQKAEKEKELASATTMSLQDRMKHLNTKSISKRRSSVGSNHSKTDSAASTSKSAVKPAATSKPRRVGPYSRRNMKDKAQPARAIPSPKPADDAEMTRSRLKTKMWKLKLQMKLLQNEIDEVNTTAPTSSAALQRQQQKHKERRSNMTLSTEAMKKTKMKRTSISPRRRRARPTVNAATLKQNYTAKQEAGAIRLQAFVRGCLCRDRVNVLLTQILSELKQHT